MEKEYTRQLRRIHKLFEQKKFKQVLPLVKELISRYPDDPFLHTSHALCYSETGEYETAFSILREAGKKFPRDHIILFYQAEILNQTERFEEAESAYNKSLEITPKYLKDERSECYNGLGVVSWRQSKRDEALKMWKLALEEYPANKVARKNLEEFTNEYRGPTAPMKIFDDPYHFQRVQTERYLAKQGRKEFESPKEMEQVIGAIFQAWNNQLAPQSKKIDAMTAAEKTELFSSIHVDFGVTFRSPLITKTPKVAEGKKEPTNVPENDREYMRRADSLFSFLPKRSRYLIFLALPALTVVGIDNDRFQSILRGDPITEEEKELFLWANDLLETVLAANAEKGTDNEIMLMQEALTIAREELTDELASVVLKTMRKVIEEI